MQNTSNLSHFVTFHGEALAFITAYRGEQFIWSRRVSLAVARRFNRRFCGSKY